MQKGIPRTEEVKNKIKNTIKSKKIWIADPSTE